MARDMNLVEVGEVGNGREIMFQMVDMFSELKDKTTWATQWDPRHSLGLSVWCYFRAVVVNLFWMNAQLVHLETYCRPLLSTLSLSSVPAPAPNPREIHN